MAKDKSDDQSRKKETPTKASPSKIDIEIVHSNDPLSEQAQLDSPSHSEALPDAREVFGTKGWNSFSFKGKEFGMLKIKVQTQSVKPWWKENSKLKWTCDKGQTEESRMDKPLSEERVSKLFIVEKRLYPYKGTMLELLVAFIHTLQWMRLFQGVCPKLEKFPQVQVRDGVCTGSTLHRVISIDRNKAKLRCLKTKQEG
ncbi:hypothetical protein E5676_scaffold284G00950 [Cucumis melo var. makuwa]|uniref:Uncharacterized protein n=1 Tax=Cucumis melo var. makuwa TaxID=1194695 RepID=A0A5D3DBE2_CUCMM|nr:hypothetical protein E5676_scaffold284G00950 [Cucumis melo var. makuwa]